MNNPTTKNVAAPTCAATTPAARPASLDLSDAAMRLRTLVVAQHDLQIVCRLVTPDVAPRAAARLRAALKSIGGAIRHAERVANKAVRP